jgi:uncharacterized membrane protein YdjX (TVP38/TMEM64 family)
VRRILYAIAAILVAALVVVLVHPLRDAVGYALHGDLHGLRAQLRSLGVGGAAVLVGLILAHAVIVFPAELVNATAGLVYGFWLGLPLVMGAWAVSALLAYWLGVMAGRPLALAIAGEKRVAQAEQLIERGGVLALLLGRLIPFLPYSIVGYVAGAARVPLWRYFWTSVVGILPITAAATYLGDELNSLSASDPLLWVAIAVLIALGVTTWLTTRRLRRSAS